MATFRALTLQSGVFKQIQDANVVGVGSGIEAQTAAQTLSITAGAGANILANSLFDPVQGIDRSTATTMFIGATNATTINIGRTGQTTNIVGDLSVQGTETVVGITTFQNNTTFEGDVTIGNAATDNVSFVSEVDTNIVFQSGANRNLYIATPSGAGTNGNNISVFGAFGSAGTGNNGGQGGDGIFAGGKGGDGDTGFSGGTGGTLYLLGGQGGAPLTGSPGAGGTVLVDAGVPGTGGTNGEIDLGATNASIVRIGRAGQNTLVRGNLTVNGNTTLGDATSDTITFTARAASSLIPDTDDTYTLGASGLIWSEVWCDQLFANSVAINGTSNLTFEVNTDAVGGTDENPALWLTGGDGTSVHRTYFLQDSNSTNNTTYVYRTEAGVEIGFEFAVGNPGSAVASLDQRLSIYGTNGASVVKGAIFNWDATNQVLRLNDNGAEGDVTTTELRTNVILGDTANPTDNTVDIQAYLQPNASLPNLIFSYAAGVTHYLQVQSATGSNTGGGIALWGGTGGPTNGNGGELRLLAGDGGGGNSNGGDVVVRAGNSTGTGTDGTVYLGTVNTGAIVMGASGITTTLDGDFTKSTNGTFSIGGNAASNLTTTAGAITVNGFAGLDLQGNGTSALVINGAGTALTVQAGATLTTTGSGNINLPNNGSARFQIETTSVGATVTAPNLDTLTNGSNADALHTHSGVSSVAITKTAGEALSAGNLLCLQDDAGTPKAYQADADGTGQRPFPVGFTAAAVTSGNPATILVSGEVPVADAVWDAVPAVGDVGKIVYMSETAGNVTLTAPSTSGSTVQKVGIVSVGGTGAVKVNIQIGEGIVLA